MSDAPRSGGEPELVAECTVCGAVYAAQRTADGDVRPIGVQGGCECGCDAFASFSG